MRRLLSIGILAILLASIPLYSGYAEPEDLPYDFAIPNGHFYKQANGQGGAGPTGFAVTDESGIPFWTWFQRYGGATAVGYPVSERFIWKDFTVQAFKKVVLQWRPESNTVAFVNVFDELSAAGKDDWLTLVRSVPSSADWSSDEGKTWEQVVQNHYTLLDQNPAIKQVYLSASDPVTMNGLPMAAQDYGDVFVVRAQRKVFQQWKQDTAWAKAGDVTVANGGDVGKEAGLYPDEAVQAAPPGAERPISQLPLPTPVPTQPLPTPTPVPPAFMFSVERTYGYQNCGLTELRGFIRDTNGAGLAGQAVKVTVDGSTWSVVSSLTGGDGQFNVFLDNHPKNGVWNVFVVGVNDAQLSPVVKLETSTDCSPAGGKYQTAAVDFKRN